MTTSSGYWLKVGQKDFFKCPNTHADFIKKNYKKMGLREEEINKHSGSDEELVNYAIESGFIRVRTFDRQMIIEHALPKVRQALGALNNFFEKENIYQSPQYSSVSIYNQNNSSQNKTFKFKLFSLALKEGWYSDIISGQLNKSEGFIEFKKNLRTIHEVLEEISKKNLIFQ